MEVKALPVANRGLTVDYTHPFRASLLGPAEQNQTDPIKLLLRGVAITLVGILK